MRLLPTMLMTVLVLGLSGCTAVEVARESLQPVGESADESDADAEGAAPSGVPTPPGGVPTPEVRGPEFLDAEDCESGVEEAVDAVIGGQLDAFAADDFAGALEFATPGFRMSFDEATFEAMITNAYPIPADATGHRVVRCVQDGAAVIATVVVSADEGTQVLLYGLEDIAGDWLIGGAVPESEGGTQTI